MSEKTYLNVRILVLTLFIIYCFPSFTMGEKDELERIIILGFPGGSEVKVSASNAGDPDSIPGSGRKWQPTLAFLPGESHGRRSLVGYSPRGRKASDTTEQLHFHLLALRFP